MTLQLQNLMLEQKKTLAAAESCTGGFISHLITKNPGSSGFFLGSMVTYCNELKQSILGVKAATLEEFGAVSEEVVIEMVQGIFNISQADFAVATSGIAGPDGGSLEKPVGTVWIAVGERGKKTTTSLLTLQGDRQKIIEQAAVIALQILYHKIQTNSL